MFYKNHFTSFYLLCLRFCFLIFLLLLGIIQSFAQINDCEIASTSFNNTDTVAMQIGYVQPYYLEIELSNPTCNLMAAEFELAGLQILEIEVLVEDSLEVSFENQTINMCAPEGISQSEFRPLLGIHVFYTQPTGVICVPDTAVFINDLEEQVVYENVGYCAILECPEAFDGIDGDTFDFNGRPFPPCGEVESTTTAIDRIGTNNVDLEFISIEPMPANNFTEVNFHSSKNKSIEILIYNLAGSLIEQKSFEAKQGKNQIRLDLSNYKSGTYLMSLLNIEGEIISKQFIKN